MRRINSNYSHIKVDPKASNSLYLIKMVEKLKRSIIYCITNIINKDLTQAHTKTLNQLNNRVILELIFYKKHISPPFRNKEKKSHKKAFSYVTRGIKMQELWFLCMTRCMNVLYKYMKFRWSTSDDFQVIERTWNSIANDQREKH